MKGSSALQFDFFPGRRFEPRERDFFQGLVFRHPLIGARQSSGFGWRKDPIHGRHAFHGGIDLAASQGTPVQAAESGEVIFAGDKSGYGRTVLIRHEYGYITLYDRGGDQLLQTRLDYDVRSVAVTPNGDRIAAGTSDGLVTLLDGATGKRLWSYKTDKAVNSVALAQDGRTGSGQLRHGSIHRRAHQKGYEQSGIHSLPPSGC
jgi:outer membrane protein assembly factor BamB